MDIPTLASLTVLIATAVACLSNVDRDPVMLSSRAYATLAAISALAAGWVLSAIVGAPK